MFDLDKNYIETLERFLDKKLTFHYLENGIEFIYDTEIQYILLEQSSTSYVFQTIEKGIIVREIEYKSALEMKRKLTLNLKGLFGEKIDYTKSELFEEIDRNDINHLEVLMNELIGSEFYSINNPEIWKINLEATEQINVYNIYILLSDNSKIFIEENFNDIFTFPRFYNEALFLKENMERINMYQELFEDKLVENEIDELLQYQ